MPTSRRGSGSVTLPSGQVLAIHHRTQDEEDLPHATKKTMADHLRKYETIFTLTPQRMRMIVEAFKDTLELGLEKPKQIVPMIPTFTGDFLAVDLVRGTNLRVAKGKFEITQSKVPSHGKNKSKRMAKKLFDFLCRRASKTSSETNLGGQAPPGSLPKVGPESPEYVTLGVNRAEERIDHGELIRWTKGFGALNTEGRDVAEMFRESLKKHDVPAELTALINDTTGTLIASAYVNPNTRIAVILVLGCNAAYMERVGDIPKLKNLGVDDDASMAINCEWGAFDSFEHEHLPRTKYDQVIDETSNKPGEQAFEKLISGRYLGEILRLVICELIDEGVLFLGQNTYKIESPYVLDNRSEPDGGAADDHRHLHALLALETTLAERQFFRALAKLVGRRAARLSACGIAAIVSKMNYLEDGCAVGADGSLYNTSFGDKGRNIVTYHAEDGSGVGSAIIASMTKIRKDKGLYAHV
ncbi:hexokinase [Lactarius hengduanensis]|nr:hexokinase [Lactarius hengduanensis]